jgi:hypothetical protein
MQFDGVNDYVLVSDNASLDMGTGDFTISAWVRTNVVNGAYHMILQKGNSGAECPNYQMGIDSNNKFYFTHVSDE